MRRSSAALGSVIFFIVTPGVVAGAVPLWISGARFNAPFAGYQVVEAAGAILIAIGIVSLIASFVRFVREGSGTPAPIAPTSALVIGGQYRYVRNPMYVAVLAIIAGQGLLFGSLATLIYGAAIFALVHTFVLVYEEPTLLDSYGDDYRAYMARVPRWLPRFPRG
jgi:protein-S-isoprenylcysteine O-methyltransferase Ste14